MLNYKMNNNTLIIYLSGNLNARLFDGLINLLARQDTLNVYEIIFDFTKTKFIKIGAAVSIASCIEYLNQKKDEFDERIYFFRAIIPPELLIIFNSLKIERFFNETIYTKSGESGHKYHGFLPILSIPNSQDLDTKSYRNLVDKYINTLIDGLGEFLKYKMHLPEKEVYDFFTANLELLTNIYEHSNGIGFAGTAYSLKHGVTCCYYDLGVGFSKTVSHAIKRNIDSIEAINWASEPNNTSKTDKAGGAGLSITKNFALNNNGILEIRSGDGRVQWNRKQQESSNFQVQYFLGSQINLYIPAKS